MKNTTNHKNQLPDSRQQLDLNHYLWQQARLEGTADLHSLTEAAKELDVVATAQNPDANHYYYSTFINRIYKELFNVPKGKTRGLRNRLNTAQLKKL